MPPGVTGFFSIDAWGSARLRQLTQRVRIPTLCVREHGSHRQTLDLDLIGPVLVARHESIVGRLQVLNLYSCTSDIARPSRAKRSSIREDHRLCPGKAGPGHCRRRK